MTIPVRGGSKDNANKVAAEIDEDFSQFYQSLKAWRARVAAASATDSWDFAERYQECASLRSKIESHLDGQGGGGISQAYIRSYPDHQNGSWNGGQEWTATKTQLDKLIQTLMTGWPKKVATTGEPAFRAFEGPPNYQLVSFPVSFNATKLNALLADIDAVLNTFTVY